MVFSMAQCIALDEKLGGSVTAASKAEDLHGMTLQVWCSPAHYSDEATTTTTLTADDFDNLLD